MKRLTRHARATLLGLSLSLAAGAAHAGPLFLDDYGTGAPDVLGSLADFDVRSLEVVDLSPTNLQITLRLNYHGGDATLAAFSAAGTSFAAVPVGVGDVLIQGQSSLWAIPLTGTAGGPGGIYGYAVGRPVAVGVPATRPTVLAGSLYQVTGSLTAGQVLGVDPAGDFRADTAVWGAISDFNPTYSGFVPIAYSLGGPEIAVLLQIAVGPAFYADVSAGYSVHFASTTCACDVIDGTVPEPAPLALLLAALTLCALPARLCFPRRGGSRRPVASH